MFGLGPTEIILVVLVLLLLFGGKKIPELMRGLGTGMKEFKKATNIDDEPEPRRGYDRQLDDRYRDDRYRDDRSRDERYRDDRLRDAPYREGGYADERPRQTEGDRPRPNDVRSGE